MDTYHIWCDLKPGVSDLTFSEKVSAWLGHLQQASLICSWRLTRRKLGLGTPALGEFHVMIETRDMAQLEAAFQRVASRAEPVEGLHFGVNSLVQNAVFSLYRDFPDAVRTAGEERF